MIETVTINGKAFPVVSSTPAKRAPGKRAAHRAIPLPLDGVAVDRGELTLSSVPPSVNALFFNSRKGRGKTLAYRNWRSFADQELRAHPSWHVPGPVRVTIQIGTERGDCDNRIKSALDLLVAAGRIEDDRNVRDVRAFFDPAITGTRIVIERAVI